MDWFQTIAVSATSFVLLSASSARSEVDPAPPPQIPFEPNSYVCYRAPVPPRIDGRIDEAAWAAARWTEDFIDIQGALRPQPPLRTRVKMMWDSEYIYFAAEMEEPDVWGKLTERDSVIYFDNDFEIFLDPNGDSHEYFELEINALGTEWDLFIIRPYRDDGRALHTWDIPGLQSAVHIDGTLNQPGDVDRGWSVEIAMPWKSISEAARMECPPNPGDQWRLNFSRVQWQMEVVEGRYEKKTDPETGRTLPEDNWVWSPQGLINLHYPERWGFVQFSGHEVGSDEDAFRAPQDLNIRMALFDFYYAQREFGVSHGHYTSRWEDLNPDLADPAPRVIDGYSWPPSVQVGPGYFKATVQDGDGGWMRIDEQSHLAVPRRR